MKSIIVSYIFLYIIVVCPLFSQPTIDISVEPDIIKDFQTKDLATQDSVRIQESIDMLKTFYVTYTTYWLSPSSEKKSDSLVRKYLTKNLIEKVDRMGKTTGSVPIVRAQDFREDVIKTISVNHLSDNWYMVGYTWTAFNGTTQTNIPVRVTKINNQYMIDYITPEWNDILYGDNLLFDKPEPQIIDASTPISLLKTFYTAYTMEYCSMPLNLTSKLQTLRNKYLTANAFAQFNEGAKEYERDSFFDYDLLIDNFDFDRLWIPSIKYTQLNENTYQMSYTYGYPTTGDFTRKINLKIIKQGNEYRIDSIYE